MTKEYFLEVVRVEDRTIETWGPFETEEHAWRYLMGRPTTTEERDRYRQAGWKVKETNTEEDVS